jgi:exonuclease SbcC
MKTIKISRFQSHKDTQLNLDPHVNIIVGQSSSGKTAIFRAIEWLNTNRPLGKRFISHGENEAKVKIDDVEGFKSDKGKTTYKVGLDTFDSGSNVPDLVTQSLNLSELNIQNQLDEHFLITSSPGEVARTFNRILNIEKVDEYVSRLTRSINTEKAMVEGDQERIELLKKNIVDLNYLDSMNKEVTFVEGRIKLLIQVKDQMLNLSDLITQVRKLETDLFRSAVTFEKVSKAIKEISPIIENLKKAKNGLDLLKKAIELQSETLKKQVLAKALKTDLESIDYSKLRETQSKKNKLQGDINQFDAIATKIDDLVRERAILATQNNMKLTEYESEIKEFQTCPICLSTITDTDHIMTEVRKRYEVYVAQ